jgi:2-isopropylmalate synthase
VSLHTTAGTSVIPTATICIRRPDGQLVQDAAIGDGPVDAIFKAVERVTGIAANLRDFAVRGVTEGKDAQGEVTLELEVQSDDRTFRGRAASTDIIEASALAYLNAVNAITSRRDRKEQREVIGRPGAGA